MPLKARQHEAPEIQALWAEAQIGDRILARRANGCAQALMREAQQLSEQRHVDIERIDAFIGVNGDDTDALPSRARAGRSCGDHQRSDGLLGQRQRVAPA